MELLRGVVPRTDRANFVSFSLQHRGDRRASPGCRLVFSRSQLNPLCRHISLGFCELTLELIHTDLGESTHRVTQRALGESTHREAGFLEADEREEKIDTLD